MIGIGKRTGKSEKLFGKKDQKRIIDRHHLSINSKADERHSWTFMYSLPPTGQIRLEDFEMATIDRLKLLRLIDNWKTRGKTGKELFELIRNADDETFQTSGTLTEPCERDWISHHVLRLAYSKNQNLQNWFRQQEISLFEARLNSVSDAVLLQIAKNSDLPVHEANRENIIEREKELSKLYTQNYYDPKSRGGYAQFDKEKTDVYAVPFHYVNSLVRTRKVLLEKGYAFLFNIHLKEYVKQHYRSKLSEAMAHIYKLWPTLEDTESDRLVPFLITAGNKGQEAAPNSYKALSVYGRQVTPDMIDDLAQQSFPLCMKVLHKNLRADHKLKHMGRMQYGLFLKGLGLSLENALLFWQEEFTKIMTDSDFTKNYAYNIRHSYGKEGKQTNYSPYGCMKIITGMSRPGADEHHGCPFRNFDERNLRAEMLSTVKDKNQIDEVIELVKGSHYQVACRRYFEVTHPDMRIDQELAKEDDGAPFLHPNIYFTKSRKLLEAKDRVEKALAPPKNETPTNM